MSRTDLAATIWVDGLKTRIFGFMRHAPDIGAHPKSRRAGFCDAALDTPGPIAAAAGQFPQAQFGDEVLGGAR